MADKEAGKVIHYYDKAMVAVVRLDEPLKVGDTVKIVRNEDEFEFKVDSMQLNHEPIESGKAGEEIAVKLPNPTKEGATVYRVEEE